MGSVIPRKLVYSHPCPAASLHTYQTDKEYKPIVMTIQLIGIFKDLGSLPGTTQPSEAGSASGR